jgi:hypothetical protein
MRRIAVLCIALLLVGCSAQPGKTSEGTSSSSGGGSANVYDAVSVLDFGSAVTTIPESASGEVVVRYGGWSLHQLAESSVGKKYFLLSDRSGWVDGALPPGIYRIKRGEAIPAVILASALLANRVEKGEVDFSRAPSDALLRMADVTSCKDGKHPYALVGLYWSGDKLSLDQDYCHVLGSGIWEARWEY